MNLPMLNRRKFLIGTCCTAHLAGSSLSHSAAQERAFICSTIEPPKEPGAVVAPTQESLTPYGTAFIADRWRKSDGNTQIGGKINLGVFFLDGTAMQRDFVRNIAAQWIDGKLSDIIEFDFDAPRHRSNIRVSFAPGEGNWSYVGRNNRSISPTQKTMNIDDLVQRVVLHEFGHALGLQHEHMHPGTPVVWNEEVVIADMAAQGWSESMTRTNILSRYSANAACVGDPSFNRKSIMMYPIPSRWTRNGVSFNQTDSITTEDMNCLSGVYRA